MTEKWQAFGWHILEIDGHSMNQIVRALETALSIKGEPTIVIANTIKGKGVSFMENVPIWHGKAPNDEQTRQALAEIEGAIL
jgi:transketolase